MDKKQEDVSQLLEDAAKTYRERRAVYGPSEDKFARVMMGLFPDGLSAESFSDFVQLGLFLQIVNKLCRYSNSMTTSSAPQIDTIHDLGVYAFMLEAEVRRTIPLNDASEPST